MVGSNKFIGLFLKQFILEFTSLVVVNCPRKPEPQDKVIVVFLLLSLQISLLLHMVGRNGSSNPLLLRCIGNLLRLFRGEESPLIPFGKVLW